MKILAIITLVFIAPLAFMLFPLPPETEFCPMGMPMSAMAMSTMQDPQDPSQDEPEGNPTHTEPTEFCRPVAQDGKMPCGCLKQDPNGCKAGKRETEHRICMSWCWKQWCKCCAS